MLTLVESAAANCHLAKRIRPTTLPRESPRPDFTQISSATMANRELPSVLSNISQIIIGRQFGRGLTTKLQFYAYIREIRMISEGLTSFGNVGNFPGLISINFYNPSFVKRLSAKGSANLQFYPHRQSFVEVRVFECSSECSRRIPDDRESFLSYFPRRIARKISIVELICRGRRESRSIPISISPESVFDTARTSEKSAHRYTDDYDSHAD